MLDLTMPDTSGEETFEVLHEIRPNIPILLSSGYSELEVMEPFKEKSVAGFMPKPYEMTTVREMLRNASEGHSS